MRVRGFIRSNENVKIECRVCRVPLGAGGPVRRWMVDTGQSTHVSDKLGDLTLEQEMITLTVYITFVRSFPDVNFPFLLE